MKGATLTRADLCEAVHEEVGLTRQDCAGAGRTHPGSGRRGAGDGGNGQAFRFRRLPGARQAGPHGPQSQDRRARRDRAPPSDRLPGLAGHEGADRPRLGRLKDIMRWRRAQRLPHDLRSRRRAGRAPARAALLGNQVLVHPPDEAGRRAAVLSPAGHRRAERRARPAARRGLHHQGRAEAAPRARPDAT